MTLRTPSVTVDLIIAARRLASSRIGWVLVLVTVLSWGVLADAGPGVVVTTAAPVPVASSACSGAGRRGCSPPQSAPHPSRRPRMSSVLVIGHRGASGYRPEHTLASFRLAIRQCADYIEPDVVMTRDGVLVVRHDNEISTSTDVAQHPEFSTRRATKIIDGSRRTGWFTEDFTLAELRTLRAVEPLPRLRPANTVFDRRYRVPTLAEVLALARRSRTCSGAAVGVIPETKHPSYFDSIGLPMSVTLVADLAAAGLDNPDSPVIIQSTETGNLRQLHRMTPVRLEQLISCHGAPWDLRSVGGHRRYADMITRVGLRRIARYAAVVGVCMNLLIPRTPRHVLARPTPLIRRAHRAGMMVVGWTFRAENAYLPLALRHGTHPAVHGDLVGEIRTFLRAGMDGFFTDQPDLGVRAARGRG